MKKIKTVFIAVVLTLFLSQNSWADWLGCDIPDPAQDIVSYAVIVDGAPEVIVPYVENTAGDAVLLWDVTGIANAQFSIYSINSQDRRSVTATPFSLLPAPSGPSGAKIVLP